MVTVHDYILFSLTYNFYFLSLRCYINKYPNFKIKVLTIKQMFLLIQNFNVYYFLINKQKHPFCSLGFNFKINVDYVNDHRF